MRKFELNETEAANPIQPKDLSWQLQEIELRMNCSFGRIKKSVKLNEIIKFQK